MDSLKKKKELNVYLWYLQKQKQRSIKKIHRTLDKIKNLIKKINNKPGDCEETIWKLNLIQMIIYI